MAIVKGQQYPAGGGSTNLSKVQDLIDTAVTFSTAGSIPFVNSTLLLTEDNAEIFWDNTSKFLGVGTAVPTSKIQVVGLPVYADNATAIAGGLTAGAFYRTGADPDLVCVVH